MAPTRDSLWGGRLVLWPPARGEGYRFNLDPVLLCGFARAAPRMVDLGTGCGVIGLLLLAQGKAQHVIGVEIQPELAALARRNVEENGLADRCEIREGDLRHLTLPPCDAVIFNPPYFRRHETRASPDAGRDGGRRERYGELGDFVAVAGRMLEEGGALSTMVPASRFPELVDLLLRHGFSLLRQRAVVSRAGQTPRHMLVEARRGMGQPLCEERPLIVHEPHGHALTAEVQVMLAPVDGAWSAKR